MISEVDLAPGHYWRNWSGLATWALIQITSRAPSLACSDCAPIETERTRAYFRNPSGGGSGRKRLAHRVYHFTGPVGTLSDMLLLLLLPFGKLKCKSFQINMVHGE